MYAAEWPGTRLRDYTEQSVLALEELDACVVRRYPDGAIKSARFRPVLPKRMVPCRGTGLSRVKFTRIEQLGPRRIIKHAALPPEELAKERARRLSMARNRAPCFYGEAASMDGLPVEL